jgi:hypothetical protein
MSEQERYLEAFKTYYSLKHDYEKKVIKMKRKIYNDQSLSDREKREELAKLEPKCINCKNVGGTIFTQEGKNLKATCGNTKTPCQLNIDITRGDHIDAFEIRSTVESTVDEKKAEIILTKLNLLFNYESEEDTAEKFEELLNDYKDSDQLLQTINAAIDDVTDNPDKQETLSESKVALYDLVSNVQERIKQYKKNQDGALIKQVVEDTTNEIVPMASKIRQLTYNVNSVTYDSDDDTYHLNQTPYRSSDIELDLADQPVVTSFVVGVKKRPRKPKKLEIAPDISATAADISNP